MDALLFGDADSGWLDCGSTTTGLGLYQTTDGGETWPEPSTDPAGVLETHRVNSLFRDGDGLYVAGISTTGSYRVVRADTRASGTSPVPALWGQQPRR